MSLFQNLGTKLQSWLEGEDPFSFESQSPTEKETAKLLERYTLNSQLPYVAFDENAGVYHNKSTVGFVLACSPLVGSNISIQKTLARLFSSIPEGGIAQVILYASPRIALPLEAYCRARRSASEIHRRAAYNLASYLNSGAYEPLFPNDTVLIRDFKVYFSLTLDNQMEREALHQLSEARIQIATSLENAHIQSYSLPPTELLGLIRELTEGSLSTNPEIVPYNPEQNLALQATSIESRILLKQKGLQLREHFDIRMLAAAQFPELATQASMQELIGQSIERGGKLGCPFLYVFNMHMISQSASQTRAALKSHRWDKLAHGPLRKWVPLSQDVYQDWATSTRRINLGDKWVEVQFLVALYTKPKLANRLETLVKDHFNSQGWILKSTGSLSFAAWLSCLPMSHTRHLMQDAMKYGLAKTVLSSNAASLSPFQGEWKGNGSQANHCAPILLLTGRKGQLITWSPFDNKNQGGNFNIAIAGKSGSGKSFVMQMIEQSVHAIGGQVWVVDEGRSHQKTCELLEGRLIDFAKADICLNPFTHIQIMNDQQMTLLKPMVALMVSQKRETTELEDAFIEQAIRETWNDYGSKNSITRIAAWLKARPEAITEDLSQMLFPYTKEGMYGRFVEGPATLTFDNRFTLLELGGLKQRPELQPIVMMMYIHQITQYLEREPRDSPKLLANDEGWRHLFTPKTAKFLEEVARTIRKHGGSLMIGTQGINDFYSTPTGLSIFENSDWVLMLKQKAESIKALKNSQRILMDEHMEALLDSMNTVPGKFSEIMIYGPQGYTIGRFSVDRFTQILYSSNADDFTAVESLRQQGLSLIEAVQQVSERV
jgi:conjugal transfer ATP-binding protein TraC